MSADNNKVFSSSLTCSGDKGNAGEGEEREAPTSGERYCNAYPHADHVLDYRADSHSYKVQG